MDELFYPSYSGECAATLCFLIMIIHCYRGLLAYSTPTEVVSAYLSLFVNCFEVGSLDVVELGVIEGLDTVDD